MVARRGPVPLNASLAERYRSNEGTLFEMTEALTAHHAYFLSLTKTWGIDEHLEWTTPQSGEIAVG